MPHAETIHRSPDARFWDRIARRYARKPVPDQQVYETKLGITDSYLEPHHEVLEIGCGTGTTALHHAPRVAHIRATDISPRMIEIARGKARDAGIKNVDFQVASVAEPGVVAGSVDVILAHNILHLLADVEGTVMALQRVLKPSGVLISTTACIGDFMPWFGYVAPLGRMLRVLPYVNVFTGADLDGWFAGAGLVVEKRWLPTPKSGVYLVARKPGEAVAPG